MIPPLSRYKGILEGRMKASYLRLRDHTLDFDPDSTIRELWELHLVEMERFHNGDFDRGGANLLSLKEAIAQRIMSSCHLCERRCGADRSSGVEGHCGVLDALVSSEFLHRGEEPPLVPSYTIFFAGCTLECAFCQNYDISTNPHAGIYLEPQVLADRIERRFEPPRVGRHSLVDGARNVNWVGGDPTPNLPYVLQVLENCRANIPQIWNSNMYLTEESMRLLDGIIDIYLTDFKYGNDLCAMRLSNAPRYWEVVTRNHLLAGQQSEVMVRHLIMPNHLDCCTLPVLEWLAENMPQALVNVMNQYRPLHRAREHPDIATHLKQAEYQRALETAKELGLHLV